MSAPFIDHLVEFVDELRERGIEIGPAALLDAGQAVEVLDLLDRESLREGLAATLLSTHMHRDVFKRAFDLWFPLGAGARTTDVEVPRDATGEIDVDAFREMVAEVMADDTAAADGRQGQLVAMIVQEFGRYEGARGEAFSAYQATSTINPQTLIAAIAAAMARGAVDDESGARPGTQPRYRRAAGDRAAELRAAIEAETQRRMAGQHGRDQVAEYAVPKLPEQMSFLHSSAKDLAQIRRTIEPLARLLASRLEIRRRRARHGPVDVRRTLRASMSTGGVPIKLTHRRPRPGRPELVIICDVSGSVSGFSQFTLQLVFALRQQFSKVRVFAFVDTVDEVTEFFERGQSDDSFGEVMHQMITTAKIATRDGHSDYGHMIKGFARDYLDSLTHRGALLILGDARNNYHWTESESLAALTERVRHSYWLNPERREDWGTGDSDADKYAEIIEMHECRNAEQLAKVIGDLLPV
ncbi:MAG: VWA domain-containing protein [Gordonia sp. (in: high G+C Gram-positive bacteria)]|uniref:vWA domain-containing protein n=1 Tax=Gordonia sp. (in: high G+C Gram-positive bacteria) TaxID=84139 RepID=UPI0039E4EE6C